MKGRQRKILINITKVLLPAIFTFTSAHPGLDQPHEGDPVLGLAACRGAVGKVVVRPGRSNRKEKS